MNTNEKRVVDQLGREVKFFFPPQRIVSLVPSQTELLYYLGLGNLVVGRTKFCIHPAGEISSAKIIGGTKNIRIQEIDALLPDLIIGNKEENEETQIAELSKKYPVWLSDVHTLGDAYEMIETIGAMGDVANTSLKLVEKLQAGFNKYQGKYTGSVAYVIWQNPLMVVGYNTFIDHLLAHLGFENAVKTARYPEILMEDLQALAPDFLFLSSEPFPFSQTHLAAFKSKLPHTTVKLVDGEAFSWYGSRLLKSIDYFQEFL